MQISDSHIGFNKGANPDVTATLQAAIDKINSLPAVPDLIIHTGDLTQISKPGEFDTVDQVLRGAKAKQVFYVPGEHDFAVDNGQQFLERYGKNTKGVGWQSFDHKGVHFIGLNNVANLKAGGMGSLGADQLEWLEDDVKGLSASTSIVVFAHIPLWVVYPEWGWRMVGKYWDACSVRLVEHAHTHFDAQDPPHGIIEALVRNRAILHFAHQI